MTYRPTDRFENWFITSLQTDINDTTSSFRLNKALNVHQGRLVIDPYDETKREIVKVTSVDGNLVYVERGDDNTAPEYHNEGTIVAMHVVAADMNDLYADFAGVVDEITAAAFLASHPVGSTYWNETVSTNPGSIYGGTWIRLEGVVLGGRSETGGSPFNVAAGTVIGADRHTLTIDEMPSHNHPQMVTASNGSTAGVLRRDYGSDGGGGAYSQGVNTSNRGGDLPHNNIQRTLVGYLWKRTA